MRLRNYVNC